MNNEGNDLDEQFAKIRNNLIFDVPRWLKEAVEHKNPRLTLDLVDSILFVYDDLDKKLRSLTGLN